LSGSQTGLSLQDDSVRQLTGVSTANQQFNYSYDTAANRYDVKTYTGIALQSESYYTVNHLNQLDTVSVNGGTPVPLHYDGNGNLIDDAAGKTYEWDAANRLVAINYTATSSRTDFAYDPVGRRVKITENGPGMTAVIQSKGTDYVLFTSEPFTLSAGAYTLTFEGLNPATNGNSNTALVDDVKLNGVLVANGGFETPTVQNYQVAPISSSWSYSGIAGIAANGSTLTSGNPSAPQGSQVGFIQNGGSLWQTANIAAGTYTLTFKVAQSSGNETYQRLRANLRSPPVQTVKTFVWSRNTIAEQRDATGATVTKRFFSEGEQRIGGSDAGKYYYTRDHLASVREVTGTGGTLQGQYDYDAWGNSVVVKGKMQVDFGFTGHYFHQPSGLNLSMSRAYSATLGRWMSRDTLEDAEILEGPNLYAYVGNNPTNWIDPTGQGIWQFIKCWRITSKWYKQCFGNLPNCSSACGRTAQDAVEAKVTCLQQHTAMSERCFDGMNRDLLEAHCPTVSVGAPPGYLRPPIVP
jgi:RHS repeat-associated protein